MSIRVGVETGVPGVIIVGAGAEVSDGLPALAATAIPRFPRTFPTTRRLQRIDDELVDWSTGWDFRRRDALMEDRSIVD